DEPQESLGGKTPLQAARKPNIDRVAQLGIVGRTNNVPKPLTPASDVATLSLFGYRSEEHTSELQSRFDLVCRLLLEKKNDDRARYNSVVMPIPLLSLTTLPTIMSYHAICLHVLTPPMGGAGRRSD